MIIGITQRVDEHPNYHERRDALDQKWMDLASVCGFTLIPIPNHLKNLHKLLQKVSFDGLILSGGNTLFTCPLRDQVEYHLLKYAIEKGLPLLGVCRGMQLIQTYFGIPLEKLPNHVAVCHPIIGCENQRAVNSFHEYAALISQAPIKALAHSVDGAVEAIQHLNLPITGIMWHPERNDPFQNLDIELLQTFFRTKECIL